MTQQPQNIEIVPSGRIDYCSMCKKDHGYNCPLDTVQSWEERWEDKFEQGFSFEGDNDPNSTPKMMFVRLHDGTKTIARPEYFKEFFKAFIAKEKEESYKLGYQHGSDDTFSGIEIAIQEKKLASN